jgi:UDP-N-acetylmuramyl pentapeptide phosphotransferase/UDP-N-acetylglucosamine-1-phosphate transferase
MTNPNDPAYPPLPAAPGYGSMPPAEYGQRVPVGPAPSSVLNAVRLMFVGAALAVVAVIVAISTKSTIKSKIAAKNPDFDSQKLNTAVNATIGIIVVFGIIVIVLFVWLALQVRKGKNWARIVTWVLSGFGILGALGSLAQNVAAGSRAVSLVSGLLDLAIVVLLMQKTSNAFFKPRGYPGA